MHLSLVLHALLMRFVVLGHLAAVILFVPAQSRLVPVALRLQFKSRLNNPTMNLMLGVHG
jgi:hypothetical protein